MENNKRYYLFDNLKFALILCVVVAHFIIPIRKPLGLFVFIYSFHMPLFIFISGLFFKDNNLVKKSFSYLIIYLLMKIMTLIVYSVFSSTPDVSFFSVSSVPWFIISIPIFMMLTHFINKYNLNKKAVLIFSIVLALYIGYDKSIGDLLLLSRAIVFFPFYFVGTIINKEKIVEISNAKKYKVFSFILLAVAFLICMKYAKDLYFIKSIFTSRNSYKLVVPNPHIGMLYRLLFFVLATLFSLAIINLCPNKKIPIITDFGSRTIQVYFYHAILLDIAQCFNLRYIAKSDIKTITYLLLSVLITFIFSTKLFSFPTKQILDLAKTDNK